MICTLNLLFHIFKKGLEHSSVRPGEPRLRGHITGRDGAHKLRARRDGRDVAQEAASHALL